MSMSFRHFFKRCPYTLSRCFAHPPYQYVAPLSLLSTFSFRSYEPANHSLPSSFFRKKFFISSSDYSSLDTTPSNPAYLSVRIRCQKHLIVSLFFIITWMPMHYYCKKKRARIAVFLNGLKPR